MRPSRNRQLSGRYWVTWIRRYAPNSDREDDLEMPFRNNAKAFIKALRDAGAHVKVDHTKRSRQTAYRKARPKDAKPYSGPLPVPDIEWDHGNLADSRKVPSPVRQQERL